MNDQPKPLIEGIDSQMMRGGSYLKQPDGTLARVEGPDLTKAEVAAAPALLEAHASIQAEAVVRKQAKDKAADQVQPEAPASSESASGGGQPVKPSKGKE